MLSWLLVKIEIQGIAAVTADTSCWGSTTADVGISYLLSCFLERCYTHPTLLAVCQELVFFLGVEDDSVRGEGDGLSLEGRAFVRADEQHLIPLIYGGTHQHHLKEREREEKGKTEVRGETVKG